MTSGCGTISADWSSTTDRKAGPNDDGHIRGVARQGRGHATWRWDRDDQLPNGRQLGMERLGQIRAALDRAEPDIHG
jgi:hypothetical protein